MSIIKPKRFWKSSSVEATEGVWQVLLDGRSVRTPLKSLLVLPTRALAEAVAVEWDAQDGEIDPANMPLTRMSNSAVDKVAKQQGAVADMLSEYGDSDLLCYRADSPQELVDRQAEAWDPVLDWAAENLGARLQPTSGVIHSPQSAEALTALRDRTHGFDNFQLAAFHDLVGITGSLILGFAAIENYAEIARIWSLSRIDEQWQEDQWGIDDEATEVAARKFEELQNAHRFFVLCSA